MSKLPCHQSLEYYFYIKNVIDENCIIYVSHHKYYGVNYSGKLPPVKAGVPNPRSVAQCCSVAWARLDHGDRSLTTPHALLPPTSPFMYVCPFPHPFTSVCGCLSIPHPLCLHASMHVPARVPPAPLCMCTSAGVCAPPSPTGSWSKTVGDH